MHKLWYTPHECWRGNEKKCRLKNRKPAGIRAVHKFYFVVDFACIVSIFFLCFFISNRVPLLMCVFSLLSRSDKVATSILVQSEPRELRFILYPIHITEFWSLKKKFFILSQMWVEANWIVRKKSLEIERFLTLFSSDNIQRLSGALSTYLRGWITDRRRAYWGWLCKTAV